jgi:hypothetical protein
LRVYQISKGMNRATDLQQFASRLEEMKPYVAPRGPGRKSKKAKATAAAAIATPAVPAGAK